MPTQLALCFDEVPMSCPAQQRYHAIAPCLAGRGAPAEIARQHLGLYGKYEFDLSRLEKLPALEQFSY